MGRLRIVAYIVALCTLVLCLPGSTIAAESPEKEQNRPHVADGPPITDQFPFPVRNVSVVRPPAVELPMGSGAKTAGILLSDDFEGSFPGTDWSVSINTGSANASWGKSTYRKGGGNASIWCAGAGSESPNPGSDVPNNMSAWAITGPYDLSEATAGLLNFSLWLETESDYDYFYWMYSTNGTNFDGFITSTSNGGFEIITQDLADWGNAGSALGKSQVWFAFLYKTDGSTTFEGAYVDQVSINTSGGGGGGGSNCGTYVLTDDNDNNNYSGSPDGDWGYCLFSDDLKHPIEFHFDVEESNITSAQLLILANDVDELSNPDIPEKDKVYINNTYLGDLTGANNEDSTTLFTVPPNSVTTGRNRVKILVNQHPASTNPRDWCVNIKQAQLIINGGCSGQASCRSVNTNKSTYSPGETVAVTYEVDTSAASQQVRVESNLVNPSGQIVAGVDKVYTTNGSSNDPKTVNLGLSSTATGGTYKAEVLVFDNASGRLESTCQDAFTVTGGGGGGGGGGGCNLSCSANVPSTVQAGSTVTYRASASTSGCTETPSYFWWTDTSTTATSFSQNPSVTYTSPGTYNWELVVVADNERCVRNGTLTVTGGSCNLNCSATVPSTAQVGSPISYQASASASGCGEAPSYFWWTDTKSTATVMSRNVTAAFEQPGTYNWQMVAVAGDKRCVRTGAVKVGSSGQTGSTVVWIPVVSHADGANNSTWLSDISIFNPTSVTATVAITIYTPSGPIVRVITIRPFGQWVRTDVVGWLVPGASLSGAIQVVGTQAVVVTTRTYNQFAGGIICFPLGTLGQALGPVRTTAAIQTGQFGWIPNLTQTVGFRSNIGFTNTSTVVSVVRVDLYNAAGTKIDTFTRTLQPGQWWQSNEPFRIVAGNNNIVGGSAKVTVTSGKGVVVYGSVVDNITNDPTTVQMVR